MSLNISISVHFRKQATKQEKCKDLAQQIKTISQKITVSTWADSTKYACSDSDSVQSTVSQTSQKQTKFYSFLSRIVPEPSLSLSGGVSVPSKGLYKLDSKVFFDLDLRCWKSRSEKMTTPKSSNYNRKLYKQSAVEKIILENYSS